MNSLTTRALVITHSNDFQRKFLSSTAFEVCGGGQPGGGKSYAILLDALYDSGNKNYSAVIFRRTYPDLSDLIDKSKEVYPITGGRYQEQSHTWRWPSGAKVKFSHMQNSDSYLSHRGANYTAVYFDEGTLFEPKQITYMLSRLRTTDPSLKTKLRICTNPGGISHEFFLRRYLPWILKEPHKDFPDFVGPFAKDGQILHVETLPNHQEAFHTTPRHNTTSRTFMHSSWKDNPHLDHNEYELMLRAQDPIEQQYLLYGNWLVKPAPCMYFDRKWIQTVNPHELPPMEKLVRSYDMAGSVNNGADFTASVLAGIADKVTYILDVTQGRWSPGELTNLMRANAATDPKGTLITIPLDPGQAGMYQADSIIRELHTFKVKKIKPSGSKINRFKPFSAASHAGQVKVLKANWNGSYFNELEAFGSPESKYDDMVDATSDAYSTLNPIKSSKPRLVNTNQHLPF